MKLLPLLLVLILSVGCSSKRKIKDVDNSETIARDFEVRDASSTHRPGWIEDAEVWVEQERMNTKNYRYFSFETEPKVNREIACNLAKANVRSDIAAEITTFIQKSLAESIQGEAAINFNNPRNEPLRNFVENTLAERVQGLIHGAAVIKTYWEKRHYMKKLGAKKDFIGFTCATLVRMDKERLEEAVDKAANQVIEKAENRDVKEDVKKALENLGEDFVKARRGEV